MVTVSAGHCNTHLQWQHHLLTQTNPRALTTNMISHDYAMPVTPIQIQSTTESYLWRAPTWHIGRLQWRQQWPCSWRPSRCATSVGFSRLRVSSSCPLASAGGRRAGRARGETDAAHTIRVARHSERRQNDGIAAPTIDSIHHLCAVTAARRRLRPSRVRVVVARCNYEAA